MPYATQQDIIDRKGEDALFIAADRDGDDAIDTTLVNTALTDATDEINVYIGKAKALPLSLVPPVLIGLCVDIALYRLSEHTAYTEEKRQRYDDAIKLLKSIASGEVSLGIDSEAEATVGQDAELIGPERQFSRSRMNSIT
jgi:phage gp36-like protein